MKIMGNKAILNSTVINLPELKTLDSFKGAKPVDFGRTYDRSGMNTSLGIYNTEKKSPTLRYMTPMMEGIKEAVYDMSKTDRVLDGSPECSPRLFDTKGPMS